MSVDAVVSDLDGTFWSPSSEVHPKSLTAVETLDAHDIPFVIATGRRGRGAHHGLVRYGLGGRPAILMNGAVVRGRLDGDSILTHSIDGDDALLVLDEFRTVGLEPVVYVDDPENDMLIAEDSAAGSKYLSSTVGYERVADLETAMSTASVIGFGAFGYRYDQLDPVCSVINDKAYASAVIGVSLIEGGHGLMVQPRGIHKQIGIEAWCEHAGVDPTQLAVVGDGHNDNEMLSAAKIAIVPSDAPPEIIALADVTIEPNETGGWGELARILELG